MEGEDKIRILAVDPGETNGWAIMEFNRGDRINYINAGTTRREEFYRDLEGLLETINMIVAEDFAVRPNYAKVGAFDWDRMPACQVLGALSYLSVTRGIPITYQSASIKPIGYGLMGEKYQRGAKGKHVYDALCHGTYYFVHRLRAPAPSFLKNQVQKSESNS